MVKKHLVRISSIILLASIVGSAGFLTAQTSKPTAKSGPKPSIVLVHGAFADAANWQKVIEILERDGYYVIAVENPLSSFAADVETTKRVIDAQKGPMVVVGHSYGGAVITEAAADEANVKALVYLAAFAPDTGEAIGAFGDKYPVALNSALRPDSAGYLYVDRAQFRDVFAKDVSPIDANVAAATQKPLIGNVFTATISKAAWKTIPAWYVVAQDDRAINPDLERFYAKRMSAKTTEIKSSHVVFISHAAEISKLIEAAAMAASK